LLLEALNACAEDAPSFIEFINKYKYNGIDFLREYPQFAKDYLIVLPVYNDNSSLLKAIYDQFVRDYRIEDKNTPFIKTLSNIQKLGIRGFKRLDSICLLDNATFYGMSNLEKLKKALEFSEDSGISLNFTDTMSHFKLVDIGCFCVMKNYPGLSPDTDFGIHFLNKYFVRKVKTELHNFDWSPTDTGDDILYAHILVGYLTNREWDFIEGYGDEMHFNITKSSGEYVEWTNVVNGTDKGFRFMSETRIKLFLLKDTPVLLVNSSFTPLKDIVNLSIFTWSWEEKQEDSCGLLLNVQMEY
jgi:hypothetical protein